MSTSTNHYRRPKGILGGPCLNCGGSQPEHVGKTCAEVSAIRAESLRHFSEVAVLEGRLRAVKNLLRTMISSAEVYVDGEGIVVAYKIKTGALHKLIGHFDISVPVNLPEVSQEAKP